jgi:vanillate O-demethylase ferredoxin subunit
MTDDTFDVRVHRMEWAAEGILSVEFRRPDGAPLPGFTAGSHIDLHLPNALVRNYSLLNDSAETRRYVVAVGLDAASRGGSAHVHNEMRVGQLLRISAPRNNFPLVEDAPLVALIAGGIGVTPLVCMARRLSSLGRPYEFHLAARSRTRAAFVEDIEALGRPVHAHFDDEHGGAPLDIAAIVAAAPAGAHFYCCGPAPMLAAFEAATAGLPEDHVHVEYFKAKEPSAGGLPPGAFRLVLAKSGATIDVPADKSILEALLEAGFDAEYSCQDGVCGTCETRIVAGVADHRDSLLSKSERASNKTMMICVSRCAGDSLTLDL